MYELYLEVTEREYKNHILQYSHEADYDFPHNVIYFDDKAIAYYHSINKTYHINPKYVINEKCKSNKVKKFVYIK